MAFKQGDKARWLLGPCAECSETPEPPERGWHLVLLGAPGTGKGTQAELLSARLGACQLSTGEVFRAARKLGTEQATPALKTALKQMESGALVSDETVVNIVAERCACLQCMLGFMLDGYPRTVPQAEALERLLAELGVRLDAVISYELPTETVIHRLSGRRVCGGCGKSYHVDTLPAGVTTCADCGADLVQRKDDRPESIAVRLEAYHEATAPLTEFYRARGLLISVDATGSPQEVFERTLAALDSCVTS